MDSLGEMLRKISCMRGLHRGGNFCIFCGKQLLPGPFVSYRVRSNDGQVDMVLKGVNEHEVKSQLRERYPPAQLTVQRIPED